MTDHSLFSPGILSRREMLQRSASGFGMLGLMSLLGSRAMATTTNGLHHRPRAKRVIFLFMNGGPSHIDTFDPKPALKKYEGKQPGGKLYRASKGTGFMPSPFRFSRCGQSGLDVSETFPEISKVIDDCCVIRSMHTDVPNHEPALLQMHTGNIQPIRPAFGSWLLYGLGSENENLPGYVVLRPSPKIVVGPALWNNSFLPAENQATSIDTSDMKVETMLRHLKNPQFGLKEQREQLDLLAKLNTLHRTQRPGEAALEGEIAAMETAYRMQMAATDVLDVSQEPEHIHEAYGRTPFAQSCLLSRRLVENGVRCVTVYYTNKGNQPWDTHNNHNAGHEKLCVDSDKATAALISDLKSRGLLEDTLVIWGGEFGRTPYAENRNKDKPAGRDHHSTAFSMLLAGGGVKPGFAYGQSDELGMNASEKAMHVHDFHATLLHLMGLDHTQLTYRYSGRDFRLTDVHGEVAHELMV
jgi:ssRNA-specific RNase YbeY (16S rRNA maturation enzyme)